MSEPKCVYDSSVAGLEADGGISVYEIGTGRIVAQYEGLEVHLMAQDAENWRTLCAALQREKGYGKVLTWQVIFENAADVRFTLFGAYQE